MNENLKIESQIENEKFMHIEELFMNESLRIEKFGEKVNLLITVKLDMNEILWNENASESEFFIEMMVLLYMNENLKTENPYEK